mgnify:FL=1
MIVKINKVGRFQFTRSRGARRREVASVSRHAVSIHAPARGATFSDSRVSVEFVSIHAPARGATARGLRQSRHEGVSIHAPARGATDATQGHSRQSSFNSRAREGRDSLPLRRPRSIGSFNSRAREGRDDAPLQRSLVDPVSIHAPTRGATRREIVHAVNVRFQFTRPRGARHPQNLPCRNHLVSIHAPARGATCARARARLNGNGFNSRAREGRDVERGGGRAHLAAVSIHAPARGATCLARG